MTLINRGIPFCHMNEEREMNIQSELLTIIKDVPDFPKKGIIFKDINPLLRDPLLMKKVVAQMAEYAQSLQVQHIIGIESRGFFFAMPLSLELNLPFIAARKKGKLPGTVISETYSLEYGTDCIEIQNSALIQGERYLIVDDVIATGGTANATAKIVQKSSAIVAGFSFLIELSFLNGRDLLLKTSPNCEIQSIIHIS